MEVAVGVLSIREFNANASQAFARVEAGETIDVTKHGKVIAEVRPKRISKLDDPVFRANYERMLAGMQEGIPGLAVPFTADERRAR